MSQRTHKESVITEISGKNCISGYRGNKRFQIQYIYKTVK